MNVSSAGPPFSACPLPRRASRMLSGRSAAAAAIATEPSSEATVARNASSTSSPAGRGRGTRGGVALGVGRHLGRDLESLDRLEVGVVVDVAVERADDVRTVGASDLLAVDGVR